MNHENTHSGEEYDSLEESTAWAVGDSGTVLQTDDRGQTWREITNDVISSLGTNSLKNGRRLTEVSLRASTVKWPSWWRRIWPPQAHQAASGGLMLPSAPVRSDPAPPVPPRGRAPGARPRPRRHFHCV